MAYATAYLYSTKTMFNPFFHIDNDIVIEASVFFSIKHNMLQFMM